MPESKQERTEKLAKMESELNLVLPQDYKDTLLDFPLTEDGQEPLLYDDLDFVLAKNDHYRKFGFRDRMWPDTLFIIGGNTVGDLYFLDLAREDSPVFAVTHEMNEFDLNDLDRFVQGFSFSIWVEELINGQEWFNTVQERRKNKKWWQFWV